MPLCTQLLSCLKFLIPAKTGMARIAADRRHCLSQCRRSGYIDDAILLGSRGFLAERLPQSQAAQRFGNQSFNYLDLVRVSHYHLHDALV